MAPRCMPWYRINTGTRHHRKLLVLRSLLANKLADVYVFRLWDYCAERQADGLFSGRGAETAMAFAVEFDGRPEDFVSAMLDAGLLDKVEGGYSVHDWSEHQAALVAKFTRDATKPAGNKSRAGHASPAGPESSPDSTPVSAPVASPVRDSVIGPSRADSRAGPSPSLNLSVSSSVQDRGVGEGAETTESLPDGVDRVHRAVKGAPYALSPADVHATRQLLALANGSVPEILRRWENGLRATYGQRVNTLAKLADREKWEGNLKPEKGREAKPASVTRGSVRAEGTDHSKTGELEF